MFVRVSRILVVFLFVMSTMSVGAQTFVFDLRGAQEVPPTGSGASGGCMGQLDQPGATFAITCVHDVAGATVMHIHRGPAGTNGAVAFDLGDPASPVTATWTGMTPSDISDLLAGNMYVNIHTAGRPTGEIRGQILARTVDTVSFTADGTQTVPPNGTTGTANCTADLDGPAANIAINCTHDLPSPQSAHVHEAPAGQIGPVVFTFSTAASPLSATMPVTPRLVADFAATFLYLDIHGPAGTEEVPGAEIRGQIGTPPAPATTGSIRILKSTSPSGGTGFPFTENITVAGVFTLDDG
jgi:CHRD domain